jgi:hypothetical protein
MGGYFVEEVRKIKTIVPQMTVTNWAGYGNQPANDGVEIISNSASDTGLCTIWGTNYSTGALTYETVTLTGTSAVSTTKITWGNIYGIFLGDAYGRKITRAAGTITVREASLNATITTLSAAAFQSGMACFLCEGEVVEFSNYSGNLYWNTLVAATALNSITEVGTVTVQVLCGKYLSLISDNTGAVVQLVVMEG